MAKMVIKKYKYKKEEEEKVKEMMVNEADIFIQINFF